MLGLLGAGLAIFLFSMQLLTSGLKAIAGEKIPGVLANMTSKRFKGVFCATGQQRLADRVDLVSLHDAGISPLADFVTEKLQATIAMLSDAHPVKSVPVPEAKADMDRLRIVARKGVLDRVNLADERDVLRFRLANDLIVQLRQSRRHDTLVTQTS
jgi:hypothetical protein